MQGGGTERARARAENAAFSTCPQKSPHTRVHAVGSNEGSVMGARDLRGRGVRLNTLSFDFGGTQSEHSRSRAQSSSFRCGEILRFETVSESSILSQTGRVLLREETYTHRTNKRNSRHAKMAKPFLFKVRIFRTAERPRNFDPKHMCLHCTDSKSKRIGTSGLLSGSSRRALHPTNKTLSTWISWSPEGRSVSVD